MPDIDKTVYRGGVGEVVEKKSRFIATVAAVSSKEEAEAFIASCKKSIGMPDTTVRRISFPVRWIFCIPPTTESLRARRESLCWRCC